MMPQSKKSNRRAVKTGNCESKTDQMELHVLSHVRRIGIGIERSEDIPENGWRRYRNFLPVILNFFGTGGSERLAAGSFVSAVVK